MQPDTILLRKAAADALTEAGYPVKASTLATLASRGGGPKFRRFGRVPIYRLSDLISWAEEKSSPPGATTTECEALLRMA